MWYSAAQAAPVFTDYDFLKWGSAQPAYYGKRDHLL